VKRREFLNRTSLLIGSGFLVPRSLGSSGRVTGEEMESSVRVPDLVVASGSPRDATRRALERFGGLKRFIRPGHVVVVKPNAGFDSPPEWGATTHPEILAGVLEACFDAGARRVIVADHTTRPAERCFQRTGIANAVAAFPKAKLLSLDDPQAYTELEVPAGRALRKVRIPLLLLKADAWINVPTAKSHSATGVSLGLKNLMGLVYDRHAFHQDFDLHQGIADLATILRPHLTVLDAVKILKTGGPVGPGDVASRDTVVVGVDPVAVDAYGIGLSTWNHETLRPEQVGHIRMASEHGLGILELEAIKIVDLT